MGRAHAKFVGKLGWQILAKRWLVDWLCRDERIRRMTLNRAFTEYGVAAALCLALFADDQVFVDPRDDRIAYPG